jgi:hypothetical protein
MKCPSQHLRGPDTWKINVKEAGKQKVYFALQSNEGALDREQVAGPYTEHRVPPHLNLSQHSCNFVPATHVELNR